MENAHKKTRDLSLPFMAVVILAIFLLSGCSSSPSTDAGSSTMETTGSGHSVVTLEAPIEKTVASYKTGAIQAYSKVAFDEATADGKKVLLDFHADWCTVCRGNEPIIKSAVEADGDIVGLKINYDTAQDLRAKYGVVSQSTLIVLQNGQENGRTMGPQSSSTITELLAK